MNYGHTGSTPTARHLRRGFLPLTPGRSSRNTDSLEPSRHTDATRRVSKVPGEDGGEPIW